MLVNPYRFAAGGGGGGTILIRGTPTHKSIAIGDTSVTLDKPTGVVDTDTVLAFIFLENNAVTGSWAAITPPTGWSLVEVVNLGQYSQLHVYAKPAGASEPANYTWTWPGTPALFGNSSYCGILAYSGASGIADSNTQGNAANSSNLLAAAVTSMAANSMLVIFFGGGDGNAPQKIITEPGSMTRRIQRTPADEYCMVNVSEEVVASGSTGTRTATYASGAFPSQCVSLVLTPA